MSQRTLAAVAAVPLVLSLWLAALFVPLPYVTYSPGLTVDVLGADEGKPRIDVGDEEAFRDGGSLVLTTVYVTRPGVRVNIFEVMAAWFDTDKAVYPYDSVYAPNTTAESSSQEAAIQMASSQDVAAAVALRNLGREVSESVTVAKVVSGTPAEGVLEQGDRILSVDGAAVTGTEQVISAVEKTADGESLTFRVERAGREINREVTPALIEGKRRVGATLGRGLDLPVDIDLRVNQAIGGPSAGLIFSLGVHDTLTEGALTGGGKVAGTGTLDLAGKVGPIGGIQQKIAASRELGAELFLVPAANCAEALGARAGDMRLVKVTNFTDALASVESWGKDRDTTLPSCERNPAK